jgi:putative SOS response-associated peptidase YedK
MLTGTAGSWQAGRVCGRYASSRQPEDMVEVFEVDQTQGAGPGADPAEGAPDYNIAPTKRAPVVLERAPLPAGDSAAAAGVEHDDPVVGAADDDGDATVDAAMASVQAEHEARQDRDGTEPVRWLRLLTWGLVPSWAKQRSVGNRMINARAETLLDKPAYRRAALSRRCLVPADGWYEWQVSPTERDAKGKPRKQPFFMQPIADGPVALAGVYELWRDPAVHPDDPAAWLASYAVITTAAEPGLAAVHDRMPLVLPPDRWGDWLDPRLREPDAVRALLVAPVAGRFVAVPVSTRVNAVPNNGPELLAPVPVEQLHGVIDPSSGELIGGADAPLF